MQPPPPVSSPGVSTAAPQKSRRNVLLCIIGSVILLMFFMMSDSTSRHFQSFTDRSDYPGGDEFASLVLENPAARVPQNPKSFEFLHPENFHSVGPMVRRDESSSSLMSMRSRIILESCTVLLASLVMLECITTTRLFTRIKIYVAGSHLVVVTIEMKRRRGWPPSGGASCS